MPTEEYRCFVSNLAWETTSQSLENSFRQFGTIVDAKVVTHKETGKPRGFAFVTFAEQRSMEDAIEGFHGKELDGRVVEVTKAKPKDHPTSRDREFDRYHESSRPYHDGGRYRDYDSHYYPRERYYERREYEPRYERGSEESQKCFLCGKLGHWKRECPLLRQAYYDEPPRYRDERSSGGPLRYEHRDRRPGPYDRGYDSRDRYDARDRGDRGYDARPRSPPRYRSFRF